MVAYFWSFDRKNPLGAPDDYDPGYITIPEIPILFVTPFLVFAVPRATPNEILTTLYGIIQSVFLSNVFNIMYLHFDWVDGVYYSRITAAFIYLYGILLQLSTTILVPKLPLKIHWMSIIFINLFFMTSGYIIYPYCSYSNLLGHIYAWYLSIEASIIYYTEEFRLYWGRVDMDSAVINRNFTVFIHRNVTPPSENTSGKGKEFSGKRKKNKKKSKKRR
uniref:Acyl_transf_3 domain-containing protein n=1 Tax=Caenorhabditis tropicalis TaxID=1561998 RepID=A0A1I7UP29_9PELO